MRHPKKVYPQSVIGTDKSDIAGPLLPATHYAAKYARSGPYASFSLRKFEISVALCMEV